MSDAAPINPYEPPQGPLVVHPVKSDAYLGPWRDGDLLVMPIDDSDECSLPSRCVITGVRVKPSQTVFAELAVPKSFWTMDIDQSLDMHWPLSDAAKPRTMWFPIVGFVLSLLVISLWARAYTRPVPPSRLDWSLVAITVAAATAMIATRIVDRMRARPFLSVVRVEMGLAWIEGAHADFLRELPRWRGGEAT